MSTNDVITMGPVSAALFLSAFKRAAEESSNELIPIWRNSATDAPYTRFMTHTVLPATARRLGLHASPECSYTETHGLSRRLDVGFFPSPMTCSIQDVVAAIEIENKEQTLSDEIAKLGALRSRLNVLFFYSNERSRERRVHEALMQVRAWGSSTTSEFLMMWNKPYQRNPHWRPCLIDATGMTELPLFTVL